MKQRRLVPSPPGEVTVHADGARWALVFVRELRHAPERVWSALTDPASLKEWAPFDTDPEVRLAEKPRLLEQSWGEDQLRWELEPTKSGTRLTLRHTVGAREMLSKVAAGWHICLDVAERFLDGAPVGRIAGEEAKENGWVELEEAYAKRFGGERATLRHQVWIDAPIEKVYAALATAEGLGTWWAPHRSRETPEGLVLSHSPGPATGDVEMLVLLRTPPSRVEWKIISHHPKESPASSWTGTRIVFALSVRPSPGHWLGMQNEGAQMTVLDFEHRGWDPASPFLGFCNWAWGVTLDMLRRAAEK